MNDNESRYYKCCICGKLCKGYGNNPAPVKDHGECCNECNSMKVIPARMKAMHLLDSTEQACLIAEKTNPLTKEIESEKEIFKGSVIECEERLAKEEKKANDACKGMIVKMHIESCKGSNND